VLEETGSALIAVVSDEVREELAGIDAGYLILMGITEARI
jgi:hypothetical protein